MKISLIILSLFLLVGCTITENVVELNERERSSENITINNSIKIVNDSIKDNWWKPTQGMLWQCQLKGKIDTSYDVALYDVDLFDTPIEVVEILHARGVKVVCYFSAGTYEDWREDVMLFPPEVLGEKVEGWGDEKWLDVSRYELFSSVIRARLDLAVQKKCDAVEPDNVDGYVHPTGFALSFGDQLKFNKWLADEAHTRGLAAGLKNDVDQVEELVEDFDFAVNEQCFEFQECEKLLPFVQQGKAVFGVEYNLEKEEFCLLATQMNFSWLRMELELDGGREGC